MKILGVYLENIRSFRKGVIVFPNEGITVIQGEVGTGKTSILMSIAYAFETPVGGSIGLTSAYATPQPRHLLRANENRGVVRVLVKQGNRLVLLERVIERVGDKYSNTSNTIYTYEIKLENDRAVVKNTGRIRLSSSDYMLKVRDVLGLVEKGGRHRPEFFTNIIYSPQFNLTSILELDPEKRREVVELALGLSRYTSFRTNLGKLIDYVSKEIDKRNAELERLENTLKGFNKQKLEEDARKLQEEREKATRELGEARDRLTVLEDAIKSLQDDIGRLEGEVKKKMGKIESLTDELRNLEDKRRELENKIKSLMQVEVLDEARISEILKEWDIKRRRIDEEIKQLKASLDDLAGREIQLTQDIASIQATVSSLKSSIRELEKEYGEKEEIVKQGKCPVCLQPILHDHGMRLLAEIRARIIEKEKEMEKYNLRLGELVKQREAVAAQKKSIENRLRDLERELEKMRREEELYIELRNIRQRMDEAKKRVDEVEKMRKEIDELNKRLEERRRKLAEIEVERKKVQELIDRLNRRIGEIDGELKRVNEQLKKIADLITQVESLKTELSRLIKAKELLEKLGEITEYVSSQLAQESFGFIRERFREILLKLAPDQPLNVELTRDYDIKFYFQTEKGVGEIRLPSGGQGSFVSLALRLAINLALRSMSFKFKDSTLLLDEPTTGLSREMVSRLKELLKILNERYKVHIIVVTHDEELLEAGSTRIRLAIRNNTTSVSYEGDFNKEYYELVSRILENPAIGQIS
ncbi:AAA family ATPase [Thermogladius sp. 4427co]|uniref:AAA family ATPase n=1 Tax=Thermogladius sp. 4427co TaxID=3450718 RepID=UPI003F7ADE84